MLLLTFSVHNITGECYNMTSKTREPKLFEAVAEAKLPVKHAMYSTSYQRVRVYQLVSGQVVLSVNDLAKATGFNLPQMYGQLDASSAKYIAVMPPRLDQVVSAISLVQFQKLRHPKFDALRDDILEVFATMYVTGKLVSQLRSFLPTCTL